MKTEFDILIIGGGLVGLTAALACTKSGASVALLDRRDLETGNDCRATALSATSLRLFENLDVNFADKLQPINNMLVTEGIPDSPWRLHFDDQDTGSNLGAIIENQHLKAALLAQIQATPTIQIFAPSQVQNVENNTHEVSLEIQDAKLTGRLLIAADGRDSVLRRSAGITAQRFDYAASSLVTTISHDMPHEGLAWQRIVKGGALAVLPLTGSRSQIVWSGPTQAIQAANDLPERAFLAILKEKMDGYLGEMALVAPRQNYPLRLQVADSFTSGRIALVGDAAHVIHPLAGQGLNLGLRDAAALASGVKTAFATGQDIGVASLFDYELWRNADTRLLGLLTHSISEISGFNLGPIGHMRRLGLAMTNRSFWLKSKLQKRAAGEGRDLPNLMQKPF